MAEDTDRKRGKTEEQVRSVWQETHELIRRLEGTSVQRLSVQVGDYKIEIERGVATAAVLPAGPAVPGGQAASGAGVDLGAAPDNRSPVVAPLLGTFYRSAQPGGKPFVQEGDVVDQGQAIAIVEAMKIMNQIVADRRGRVAEILLKDGDWVEFQQVLMYLEPVEG